MLSKYLLWIFIVVFFSCSADLDNCKQVHFTPSLIHVDSETSFSYDIDKTYIVQYLSYDCTSCIKQISSWQEIIAKFNIRSKVNIVIVGDGDLVRIQHVLDKLNFDDITVLYDFQGSFLVENQIIKMYEEHCFILNKGITICSKLPFSNKDDERNFIDNVNSLK